MHTSMANEITPNSSKNFRADLVGKPAADIAKIGEVTQMLRNQSFEVTERIARMVCEVDARLFGPRPLTNTPDNPNNGPNFGIDGMLGEAYIQQVALRARLSEIEDLLIRLIGDL